MTLRHFSAGPTSIPTAASWYLADLGEAKGRQELFTRQSPQNLKSLREHALIERLTDPFSVADVQRECPGVGLDMIRKILKQQRQAGGVECTGLGRTAAWRKTAK